MDKADPVGSLKRVLSNRGYPGDARLRQLLATRPLYDKSTFTRDRTTLVLDAVNRHLSAGTGGYTVLSGASTIEHILPQSMGPEWLDELGPNAEDLHREYVHTLGNLTLVTQDWNSSLSNAPFAIKRKRLAGHALRLNSDYFSEEIAAWDEAAIRARGAFLVEQILAIWPALAPGAVQAAPAASASFHGECVERIEQHLRLSFIRRGPVTFSTGDGKCRLMVAVSKRYERSATPGYWFAFHPSQQAFLEEGERGYAAFGCGSAETVFLFALDDFLPFVARMGTTATEDRHYWHVKIYESGSRFVLGQPGMGNNVDITTYRLESKPIK
jgi:hypothetical protein